MSFSPAETASFSDSDLPLESSGERRFKPIPLSTLIGRFVWSRGILCLTAPVLALVLRCCIDKPFRWFEWGSAILLLLLWPQIELWVHHQMHHAEGTLLYRRHLEHHNHPLDDTALGDWRMYLVYNLSVLPWFLINWAWALTLMGTFLAAVAIYEFVHFSTHFRYRPFTNWGKRVRRNHLLHHREPNRFMEVVFPPSEA
ncbi:MAG: sterol desaturase family protein [Planctomycetota bacterium]|jgi:hypothetical protein